MKLSSIPMYAALFSVATGALSAGKGADTSRAITETLTRHFTVVRDSAEHRRLVQFLAGSQNRLSALGPVDGDFHVTLSHRQVTPAGAAHKPFHMPPLPYDTATSAVTFSEGDTLSIDTCSAGNRRAWVYLFRNVARPSNGRATHWEITHFATHFQPCGTQE
jgi:hypothetical protein